MRPRHTSRCTGAPAPASAWPLSAAETLLATVLPALLLAAALAPLPLAAQAAPGGAAYSPMAGSRVFGTSRCSACHPVRGFGTGDAPDLGFGGGSRSAYDLAAELWNHLPEQVEAMRSAGLAPPRLPARDAGSLVAFLYSLRYLDPAGAPERGRRLFRQKGCAECHQVGGVGGVVGPSLDFLGIYAAPIQVAAAMWNHGPRMLEAFDARDIPRPEFTGSEFGDLIAFLEGESGGVPERRLFVLPGNPEVGRDVFRRRGCIECHGPPGGGGRAGPDLAERARGRSLLGFAAAMWNHQPGMLAEAEASGREVPELEPAEMADLVAYLSSFRYLEGGGSAARGRRLLGSRDCLDCHARVGAGGTTDLEVAERVEGSDPSAVIAALWNHVPAALERDLPADAWPSLGGDEVADLAAFLLSVEGRER